MKRRRGGEDSRKGVGRAVLLVLLFLLIPLASVGQAEEPRFSVSITGGTYRPSLKTLNRILGDPHTAILQDPNYLLPHNLLLPAERRNIIAPKIEERANYGVEAQWEVNDDFSLVATLSVWQGDSIAEDRIDAFIRQDLPPVHDVPRSARYEVSLSQIWLGWKYNLLRDPERGRVFVNVGLAGISLADVSMDTLFKVITPDQNFAASSSTEARGLAYTTRLGIGGEYFLTEWLSVGINVNYVIGTITNLKVKRHFRQNFSDIPNPPAEAVQPPDVPTPQDGEGINYATVQTQNITDVCSPSAPAPPPGQTNPFGTCGAGAGSPLKLELDGLQISAAIRFYF